MARVALVTGGMGGLGEAICIKMVALGYKVVTTYSPSNKTHESWLATMKDQGYNFTAYPCECRTTIRRKPALQQSSATSAQLMCW
jgi:acetoacetyl-CoA reductase